TPRLGRRRSPRGTRARTGRARSPVAAAARPGRRNPPSRRRSPARRRAGRGAPWQATRPWRSRRNGRESPRHRRRAAARGPWAGALLGALELGQHGLGPAAGWVRAARECGFERERAEALVGEARIDREPKLERQRRDVDSGALGGGPQRADALVRGAERRAVRDERVRQLDGE